MIYNLAMICALILTFILGFINVYAHIIFGGLFILMVIIHLINKRKVFKKIYLIHIFIIFLLFLSGIGLKLNLYDDLLKCMKIIHHLSSLLLIIVILVHLYMFRHRVLFRRYENRKREENSQIND